MKIIYSPEAIYDLQRLRDFIEINNPIAAKVISKRLLEGIEKLKTFPRMGIEVNKASDPDLIRDLILGIYTVRYLLEEKHIYILRIWHQKEDEIDS